MNRIYKVVWSKAKNCYTVVSEIAKRHGKGNRARTCAAAFLAAFALTGVMGMSEVQAAVINVNHVTIDDSGNVATNSIQTNALNSKYNLTVGTANPNGTMPFFVNSNGAFYAANGKLVVDKDGNVTAGKVTATEGEIGNVVLKNGVYTGHSKLLDSELSVGDASGNYSQITTKGAKLGKVTVAEDGKISGVAAGAITADSTDAVNGSQLHAVATEAGKHSKVVNGSNINVEEAEVNGQKIYKVGLNDDVLLGKPTGNNVSISGTNGTIETTGSIETKDRIIADKGAQLGKVTISEEGKITGVAAGAVTAGSTDAVNGSQLHAVATEAAKHSKVVNGSNIKVEEAEVNGQKIYKVGLNDDVLLGKPTGNNVSISGTNGTIETTGSIETKDRIIADKGAQLAGINVSGNIISNGAAKIALYGDSGVAGMVNGKGASIYMQDGNTVINSKVAIDKDGKVTGVAAGALTADSTDAVNGRQLYATNQLVKENASNISLLGNSINKLDNRVDKVGAGAAALAALHPLSFDPEDKWDFAAGYGNYSGASAVALGAYYRPNEDTMFSVGGSFGNGENMVNAGVSLKLGQSNHAPASKAAMEKKISALSQEVEELKAAIADLRAAQTKAKDATEKDAQKK